MKKLMCLLVVLAFAGSASAALLNGNIVSATQDSIDGSWTTGTAWDVVNGNGFKSGTSLHATCDTDPTNHWTGNGPASGGAVDAAAPGLTAGAVWLKYEFDQVYQIDEMKVWNHNINWNWTSWTWEFGWEDVIVGYSTDGVNWNETGLISLNNGPGNAWNISAPAEQDYDTAVNLGGISAKYIALTCLDDHNFGHGGGDALDRYSLAEVQFEGVPEPATIVLLGLGGLTLIRRRKH